MSPRDHTICHASCLKHWNGSQEGSRGGSLWRQPQSSMLADKHQRLAQPSPSKPAPASASSKE
eukprot:1158010-Pelagomonas_calceolata.AAC.10